MGFKLLRHSFVILTKTQGVLSALKALWFRIIPRDVFVSAVDEILLKPSYQRLNGSWVGLSLAVLSPPEDTPSNSNLQLVIPGVRR